MKVYEVFGISTKVNEASYIDRANLDLKIRKYLNRDTHIALKGASKSGKSWLRQQCIVDSNTIQCRLGKSVHDIYIEALGNLGIKLIIENSRTSEIKGIVEASGEAGFELIAKVTGKTEIEANRSSTTTYRNLKCDLNNLKFFADLINESRKKLVIEDFHYLSLENRKQLAFDLKTLWDLGCYVVIIGVWTQSNLLTFLNPELTGRIKELSITWNKEDLRKVLGKGCSNLGIIIDKQIVEEMVTDSFGNVGILQTLALNLLDEEGIEENCLIKSNISNKESYKKAAQEYANQLDGVYQQYAKVLSNGIRKRRNENSTGIYAYTMKAIVEASDEILMNGFSRDNIFYITHGWQPRIQIGNLQTILRKLEELQQDSENKTLVIGYDESIDSVFVIDRQLLFYRKHHTMQWPWEELIAEENDD